MKTKFAGTVLIIMMFASMLLVTGNAQAATIITVTTTTDSVTEDGQCSLREAVLSANTDSAVGGCAAGTGTDTIHFDASLSQPMVFTLSLTGSGEDAAATGDLDVTGTLIIAGAGQGQTVIDGNGTDRVFDVLQGANLTLSDLTVRNGNPGGGAEGAGIRSSGRFTISDSIVTSNQGNGITNDAGQTVLIQVNVTGNTGYGIYNMRQGTLTYTGGEVSGNQNGGIFNTVATATLMNIRVLDNTGAGGVANVGSARSRLTMTDSLVMGNSSSTSGGGIKNDGSQNLADIRNTTISSNQADSAGGGVFNIGVMALIGNTIENNRARSGAGVDHFGGQLSMNNDTVSGNVASDNGGGLYNRDSATLVNVTFNGNTANGQGTGGNIFNDEASISIKNTILANPGGEDNCFNSEGFVNSLGHNLESGNTCGFTGTGDLINTDPLLGALQDNGGPTFTNALQAGSPAIDGGDNADCPKTDQRGSSRPVDGNGDGTVLCDIGAFEFNSIVPTITATTQPTATFTPPPTETFTPGPVVTNTPIPSPSPTPIPPTTPCASAMLALIAFAVVIRLRVR